MITSSRSDRPALFIKKSTHSSSLTHILPKNKHSRRKDLVLSRHRFPTSMTAVPPYGQALELICPETLMLCEFYRAPSDRQSILEIIAGTDPTDIHARCSPQ